MTFFSDSVGPPPYCWWCGHSVSFHKPGGKCLHCPDDARICGPKLQGEPVKLKLKDEGR